MKRFSILFFNILTVLLFAGIAFFAIPIKNLENWQVRIVGDNFTPGDTVGYVGSFTKKFDSAPSSYRELQCTNKDLSETGTIEIQLPDATSSHTVGAHSITTYVYIPDTIPQGTFNCRMHTHVHYMLFGVKPSDQDNYSNSFTVTSKGVNKNATQNN